MVVRGRCCCVEGCTFCAGSVYPSALQLDLDGNAGVGLTFDPGGAGSPQQGSNGSCDSLYHVTADLVGAYGVSGAFGRTGPGLCGLVYEYPRTLTAGFCIESWSWDGSMWIMNSHAKAELYALVNIWRAVDGHIYRKWNSNAGFFAGWSFMFDEEDMGTDPFDCCEPWTATPWPDGSSFTDATAGTLTVTPICE